jgi:hypothetical protein
MNSTPTPAQRVVNITDPVSRQTSAHAPVNVKGLISNNGKPVAGKPVPVPKPAPAPTPIDTSPGSAYSLIKQTLTSWGLDTLIPHIQDYLVKGYTNDDISLALQDTKEWHQRFAGNDIRAAKGLSVLSPAQYLAAEDSYRQVLQSYGMPAGFYDSHDDFNNFIGNDISPSELSTRAQVAHDQYMNAPQVFKDYWSKYGFAQGDAIASILDPTKATALLQDQAAQVGIGATAKLNGFDVSQQRAQQLQQRGVTLSDAQKAYQAIGQSYGTDQNIANRFHTTFGQTQEENSTLGLDPNAVNQRNQLYASEQAQFQGHGNSVNAQTLSVSQDH